MYAVGIKNYDVGQLEDIASMPYSDFLYTVSDFSELNDILTKFGHAMCNSPVRYYDHGVIPDYARCYQDPCSKMFKFSTCYQCVFILTWL